MSTEINIHQTFISRGHLAHVTVHVPDAIDAETYSNLCEAMEKVKYNFHLLVPQPTFTSVPQTVMGAAHLDPSDITAKIPGIDPTDRRRGPKVRRKK